MLFGLPLLTLLSTNYRVESLIVDLSPAPGDGPIQAWEKLETLKTSSELEGDWHSEASIVPENTKEHQPIQWLPEVQQQDLDEAEQDQQQGSMDPLQEQPPPWSFQKPPQLAEDTPELQQPAPADSDEPQEQFLSVDQTPAPPILVPRGPAVLQPLNLPLFTRIMSLIPSGVFKPEGGTRPLPIPVKQMFLPPAPTKPTPRQYGAVDVLCHLDRIYVRIKKELFVNPSEAWRYLKVGTCPVNEDTAQHYYFLYYLKGCGLKYEEKNSYSMYSNTLTYNPPTTGPILRELPFSVKVICKYYKHFNAYAISYPRMRSGTVFARLSKSSHITLKPYDENWKPPMPGHSFAIGKPMNFEAKVPSVKAGERTYVNKCYITPTNSPESPVKYVVVENNGCLVDSKISPSSKFIPYAEKTALRFSTVAFVFKDSTPLPTGQRSLYLHCEITVGPETPSPSVKSCTYDRATKKWKELLGDASVCACCDSTCPAPAPRASRTIVSSDVWMRHMTKDAEPSELRIQETADILDLLDEEDSMDGFEKYWFLKFR